jgi:hypothetical protein
MSSFGMNGLTWLMWKVGKMFVESGRSRVTIDAIECTSLTGYRPSKQANLAARLPVWETYFFQQCKVLNRILSLIE